MIPLARDRSSVDSNFRSQKKLDFEEDLLFDRREALRTDAKQKFASKRWKEAKPQLLAETFGKCAYCEAPTHEVAFGDVEHYRPKSEYWWLAYNYDNYLASCQLCNQKFKKAKFPITNAKLRAPVVRSNSSDDNLNGKIGTLGPDPVDQIQVDAFEALHDQERPLLLNPYFDQPDLFYAWVADGVLREVQLVPASQQAVNFVQAAISAFGLNRPELQRARYRVFMFYRMVRHALDDPGISATTRREMQQSLVEMAAAGSPYAGMIRFFDTRATNTL